MYSNSTVWTCICEAACSTWYLLSLNSACLKRSVSTGLLPAPWFMTCLRTLGTLYLFSTAERHWMATGSLPHASRKLITSIAPACAATREGKGVNVEHAVIRTESITPIYNEESYSFKKCGGWGGVSYSTVMKFHYAVLGIGCTAAILSKHSTVCSPLPLNGTLHSMLTEILRRMQLIIVVL